MNALREKGKVSQATQIRKEEQEIKIVVSSPQARQEPKPEASKPPEYNRDWLA